MNTVLFVDDAGTFLTGVEEGLKFYDDRLNVLTAANGRQAVRILHSVKVDLVVTDLRMPEMDGFELISCMSRNYQNVPVIAMTAFSTPETDETLRMMGAIPLLEKPVSFEELADKIFEVLEAGSMGRVCSFSLSNFLRLIEIEQKTMTLHVTSEGRTGRLYLLEGSLMDAETPGRTGYEAAIEIIGWRQPEIEMRDRCVKTSRMIKTSLMKIVMEIGREKDERENRGGEDEDLLREAIRRTEGNHFKEARSMLAQFLKLHPRNHQGWLWHSRVTGAMKAVERSLIHAHELAPSDQGVAREIANFNLAKKRGWTGKLKRCPFCWSVIEAGSVSCPACMAFLIVRRDALARVKYARVEELEASVQRYARVLGREKNNLSALYYLGVAMLNLENWTEGVDYLSKAARLAPEDPFFAEQLNTALTYLAALSRAGSNKRVGKTRSASGERTILVVESNATTRMVITAALKGRGRRVLEAEDGIEALNILKRKRPDLIVMDVMLPEMDGYQILNYVKRNKALKSTPVVVVTAKDAFFDKLRGRLAGSAKYLTKPFDPEKLVDVVNEFLK